MTNIYPLYINTTTIIESEPKDSITDEIIDNAEITMSLYDSDGNVVEGVEEIALEYNYDQEKYIGYIPSNIDLIEYHHYYLIIVIVIDENILTDKREMIAQYYPKEI